MELMTPMIDPQQISDLPGADLPTDRELLKRFLAGEESAFSRIVERHTPLVLSVCQRVLRERNDAEDAFQATFLVLARKAKSLEWQDSIAGWLHQTARRTALKLRTTTVRRRIVESQASQQGSEVVENAAGNRAEMRELGEILDAELTALPARFREVILLTQVEGLTRDEASKRLGITVAAVKDRLERAREQLRSRLLRRGITLSAATLAAWLIPETVQAAGISALATSTSQAASAFAAGSLTTGTLTSSANLAQGVLHMMGIEKLKSIVMLFLTVVTAGGIAYGMLFDEPTRFEKGLRGNVVAVNPGPHTTVTISLEGFDSLLNLDVSDQVKVWTAFEQGQLGDLKEGQYVSLRLDEDHRTINEIHVQGEVRSGTIKSVTASGKIIIEQPDEEDEEKTKQTEVVLAPNAILRIGGLPATRSDLKPGMQAPLEFSRDGKLVNAIEADAAENSLIAGEFLEIDAQGQTLSFHPEGDESEEPCRKSIAISPDLIMTVDGKPAKVTDLKKGAWLTLRLSDDGASIRAIKANSPEPEACEQAEN